MHKKLQLLALDGVHIFICAIQTTMFATYKNYVLLFLRKKYGNISVHKTFKNDEILSNCFGLLENEDVLISTTIIAFK
jgi:hypothetical protein